MSECTETDWVRAQLTECVKDREAAIRQAQVAHDRIKELEAENRHLRILLDSYGRLSTHKTSLTELRGVSREADEYIQTKTRAAQVKGQHDE